MAKIFKKLKQRNDNTLEDKNNEISNEYVLVPISKIKKGFPFIKLFPIKPDVLASISKDMGINGFDKSQPVIIWRETGLLIDGHTRCKAAEKALLKEVAAVYYSFPDVDSAIKYAYGLQFKRRNLDDSDRFSFAEQYLNNVVQDNKKGGWKKKELAEMLSISMSTAQKYLSVINRCSDKEQEAVRTGDITINTAYKKLLQKEGGEKKKSDNETIKERFVPKEVSANTKPIYDSQIKTLIHIDTRIIKKKVDMWAKNRTSIDRIVAINEILPPQSEIAKYVKGLLGKEKKDVSL